LLRCRRGSTASAPRGLASGRVGQLARVDPSFGEQGAAALVEGEDLIEDGIDLAALVDKRLAELHDSDDVVFPAPHGGWARRSNYGRNLWDPAARDIGWPRHDNRWRWTFHSLRHVFATWALNQPGLRLEDVSRLLGHSSTRVTQDVYIHVHGDLYQRFYDATAAC
jgi:integrase